MFSTSNDLVEDVVSFDSFHVLENESAIITSSNNSISVNFDKDLNERRRSIEI